MAVIIRGLFGVVFAFLGYIIFNTNIFLEKTPPKVEEKWWGPGESSKEDTSIHPFKIGVPLKVILDLNNRLADTKFCNASLEEAYFHYGFNAETLEKIIHFWRHKYNWREREVFLNKYPHFRTTIQGLSIHFLHVKPKNVSKVASIPLLLLHGWPGSFREFYRLIERLNTKDLSFEIIVPSLPGFGYSRGASKQGFGSVQMAQVLTKLMKRLGHKSWFVHGGDWGSTIASDMGILYPDNVRGIHLNSCQSNSLKTILLMILSSLYPSLIMEERFVQKLYPLSRQIYEKLLETGASHIQATKPDTIGAALADSPAGLAAYILEKFSTYTNKAYRELQNGGLLERFTYTDLLDNIMIYWVTNSMTTSMRIFAEDANQENMALGFDGLPVKVPTWCARFPEEIVYQPDWMLRHRYPNLIKTTDMTAGGHFSAMEVPDILAEDIREAITCFMANQD